jgi:hypothetical protein
VARTKAISEKTLEIMAIASTPVTVNTMAAFATPVILLSCIDPSLLDGTAENRMYHSLTFLSCVSMRPPTRTNALRYGVADGTA